MGGYLVKKDMAVGGFFIVGLFLLISGMHMYWALGGRWGLEYVIPEREGKKLFSPKPIGTIAVALVFLFFVWIVLEKMKISYFINSDRLVACIICAMSFLFFIRSIGDFKYVGFFKKYKQTKFAYWDRCIFIPLSLAISVFLFILILVY